MTEREQMRLHLRDFLELAVDRGSVSDEDVNRLCLCVDSWTLTVLISVQRGNRGLNVTLAEDR